MPRKPLLLLRAVPARVPVARKIWSDIMSFRSIKRAARRALHQEMRVPAFYIPPGGAESVPCYVRVHTAFKALGDVKGTSYSYAEREDTVPKIIFMRDQVLPRRQGVVSVEPGEAYRLDATEPPDDLTITARAVRLTEQEALGLGLPVPEEADDSFEAVYSPVIFPRVNALSAFTLRSLAQIVSLQGDESWAAPLAGLVVVSERLPPLLAAHDFFDADLLHAYALHDGYTLRIEFTARSAVPENSVTLRVDSGAAAPEYLGRHAMARQQPGTEQPVSITAQFSAGQTLVDTGAEVTLRFSHDVEIRDMTVYLSL
jgi:hypothetical protein